MKIKDIFGNELYDNPATGTMILTLEAAITADTMLFGADLYGQNLAGVNLTLGTVGAKLKGAVLYGANLTGATMGATGKGANLEGATLYGAHCNTADCTEVNFNSANMYGADGTGATVTSATFVGANRGNAKGAFAAPPVVIGISPATGAAAGSDPVTISGTGFALGATVDIGGNPATSVVVVNSGSITCVTPAHAVGAVNVAVTANAQTGTLTNGFTYV